MAFLGDFGKFFGLGSTGDVVSSVTGSKVLGNVAQAGSNLLGSAGDKILGSDGGVSPASTADQALEQSAIAVRSVGTTGAQEISTSGTNIQQAGFGALPSIASGAFRTIAPKISQFFGSTGGQLATSVATGVGVSMLGSGDTMKEKPVLTQSRRNKARVRQLVNFMGIAGSANFLSQSSGRNISETDVVMLLLRTFRNDGAFITKAQVRNLRRTTNRFKSLEKQVKEATSMTKTTRRSSPVRRASSTTLIKN